MSCSNLRSFRACRTLLRARYDEYATGRFEIGPSDYGGMRSTAAIFGNPTPVGYSQATVSKKIWSINFSTRAKNVWRGLFSCWRISARRGKPEPIITKVSQETLAEMIGTTRARVSFFMNKFRRLGFISYNGKLEVHSSLLTAVLYDKPEIQREP